MTSSKTKKKWKLKYTEEERAHIIDFIMALKASQIRDFLSEHGIPKTGNKSELRERIQKSLDEGLLEYSALIGCIDGIEPWGKQHVFLYSGPEDSTVKKWRKIKWVENHLKRFNVARYLNSRVPLILPKTLKLSAIHHSDSKIRIIAVEKREYWERLPDQDSTKRLKTGEEIELRAFVNHVKRGLVSFDWNLISNQAMLQISQLPSGSKYEIVEKRFIEIIQEWLDLTRFTQVELNYAISKLHRKEENGNPEARSHAIHYSTIGGRRLSGRSPSSQDSLFGEDVMDKALSSIRNKGVGHLGNFYWLPNSVFPGKNNILESELHMHIIASKNRIAFPTPNREEDIQYVLSRVRELSK